jgi:thioredoxin reductase
MHPSMREYDLVVVGSGPGGQKAAIAAAKLGKSVAVIEHGRMLGGVCVHTARSHRRHCARPWSTSPASLSARCMAGVTASKKTSAHPTCWPAPNT